MTQYNITGILMYKITALIQVLQFGDILIMLFYKENDMHKSMKLLLLYFSYGQGVFFKVSYECDFQWFLA